MLELGDRAEGMHRDIGMEAVAAGIDVVVGIGELARAAVLGARDSGLSATSALHLPDVETARDAIGEIVTEGDLVLIKGSRGMALERLVDALRSERVGVTG